MASTRTTQRARDFVIRYLVAAHISSELKCLDKEGNFSPHTVHNFLLTMGRIVAIMVDKFAMEPYKSRQIAQRVMLTYLVNGIEYPIKRLNEWFVHQCMLSKFRSMPLHYTLQSIQPTCRYHIQKRNKQIEFDGAWDDITKEVAKITSTWLMKDEPYGITEEGLQALLCLYISKFYGLVVGKRFEKRESVRYFLEREVLDYITEEGLEINYVLDQRKRKKTD